MAFNTNAQQSNVAPFNNRGGNDDGNWKADAFLNIYVPTKAGKRRRLIAVPLKQSRPRDAALIERLKANPDDVEALQAVLELEFHMAEGEEDAQFDF